MSAEQEARDLLQRMGCEPMDFTAEDLVELALLISAKLTVAEIRVLAASERCACGHAMVLHNYDGGLDACAACECRI